MRDARFAAVRTIASLATEHAVDAVLVAGDVFDSNHVADRTILQALVAMRGYGGPWVLLPGNHDAALAESVWSRLERLGLPANCILARTPQPIVLADGRLVVLPAPLTERHSLDDLSAWMDEAETATLAARVGLAHGCVAGRLPAEADAVNPIAADRARTARLDYLALGDWHGTLEIAPRAWYAGTPEPDRFKANAAGQVLLVEIDGPGATPRVQVLPTGSFAWQEYRLDLSAVGGGDEPAAAIDQTLAGGRRRERRIVRLTLAGTVDLAARARIEAVLQRWRGELCHFEVEDRLAATPSDADLARLGDAPVVGRVAHELAQLAQASGDEEERAVAALALRLLFVEHGRLEGGR